MIISNRLDVGNKILGSTILKIKIGSPASVTVVIVKPRLSRVENTEGEKLSCIYFSSLSPAHFLTDRRALHKLHLSSNVSLRNNMTFSHRIEYLICKNI